jgi:hypothetical protein
MEQYEANDDKIVRHHEIIKFKQEQVLIKKGEHVTPKEGTVVEVDEINKTLKIKTNEGQTLEFNYPDCVNNGTVTLIERVTRKQLIGQLVKVERSILGDKLSQIQQSVIGVPITDIEAVVNRIDKERGLIWCLFGKEYTGHIFELAFPHPQFVNKGLIKVLENKK